MQKKEPWKKVSNDKAQSTSPGNQALIDNCLHLCLHLTANLAILSNPFLPNTAKKMLNMMKVVDKMLDWENAGKIKLLSVGYSLRAPELLFRKIEDNEINAQVDKLKNGLVKAPDANNKTQITNSQMETNKTDPAKNRDPNPKTEIVYDDFAKLDLRVGTVKACEKVEKADKLLKLTIDLGSETRTIVSGIALHYKAEEMVGKQVVVVVNLAPRKMKGIESQGMILTAEDSDGKLRLLKPEEAVSAGSSVS
jgi:methionyl-tRNA synthetase